jgi:hypothetical protein
VVQPRCACGSALTSDILTEENRSYLATLPSGPATVQDFDLIHGSPVDEDEYLVSIEDVQGLQIERTLSFFGHTHLQGGSGFTATECGRSSRAAQCG